MAVRPLLSGLSFVNSWLSLSDCETPASLTPSAARHTSSTGVNDLCSTLDYGSAAFERRIGCLEHLHHAQAGTSVIERPLSLGHTVQKVAGLELQCLSLFNAGRPHVSAPVAHQKLVDSLFCSDLDALVVDFDFFGGIEIVPHHHPPLPADPSGWHIDRGQPVHADVGGYVVWEIERVKGHVLQSVQMRS